jgi:hypothetical protein
MDKYAEIKETRHLLPMDRYYSTYEWIGSPWWPVRIEHYWDVKQFPWKLKLAKEDFLMMRGIYVRTDKLYWLTGIAICIRDIWAGLEVRIVMTAFVWGLAYVPPYAVPNWGCMFKKKGISK